MVSVGHVLGHVLDHVPDLVSDHMIIGLVATALQSLNPRNLFQGQTIDKLSLEALEIVIAGFQVIDKLV